MNKIIPIILAGGAGTRLWPLSQANNPKQFIKPFGGLSLFQITLLRNQFLGKITVITIRQYQKFVTDQSNDLAIDIEVIIEPISRNTAISYLIAALYYQHFKDSVLLFLPCDHYINDEEKYNNILKSAANYVVNYNILVIGVRPLYANSNYGYVKANSPLANNFYEVEYFQEKPSEHDIEQNFNYKDFFWHTGICLINTQYLLQAAEQLRPSLFVRVFDAFNLAIKEDNCLYLSKKWYEKIIPISFEYAFIESLENIKLLEADFEWHDLGSFEAIIKLLLPLNLPNIQNYLNFIIKLIIYNCQSTSLASLQNILPAAITKLEAAEHYQSLQFPDYQKIKRTWGYYQILFCSNLYKVKELIIYPGAKISLQFHYFRNEFWVVIEGTGEVIIGEIENLKTITINQNDYLKVPVKAVHQVINMGTSNLKLLEIQTGKILNENDIVRLDENYNRIF